ncbi:MAG: hypothetical protein C6W56_04580 [Caldibacillus debilis]|nr:MAG: hypothetical protein C6W56_04580 [Caldibacillus debilis]
MFPFDGGILPVLARSAVRLSGGRVSGHLEDDFWFMLMVQNVFEEARRRSGDGLFFLVKSGKCGNAWLQTSGG